MISFKPFCLRTTKDTKEAVVREVTTEETIEAQCASGTVSSTGKMSEMGVVCGQSQNPMERTLGVVTGENVLPDKIYIRRFSFPGQLNPVELATTAKCRCRVKATVRHILSTVG